MRAYSTEVMSEVMQSTRVVKGRILRQHELVKRENHSVRRQTLCFASQEEYEEEVD